MNRLNKFTYRTLNIREILKLLRQLLRPDMKKKTQMKKKPQMKKNPQMKKKTQMKKKPQMKK